MCVCVFVCVCMCVCVCVCVYLMAISVKGPVSLPVYAHYREIKLASAKIIPSMIEGGKGSSQQFIIT